MTLSSVKQPRGEGAPLESGQLVYLRPLDSDELADPYLDLSGAQGVLIDDGGAILTAAHAASELAPEGFLEALVFTETPEGVMQCTSLGIYDINRQDVQRDLAVLYPRSEVSPVRSKLTLAERVQVGDKVHALSWRPWARFAEGSKTVGGSACPDPPPGRYVVEWRKTYISGIITNRVPDRHFLELSVQSQPGDSGIPVFAEGGGLVGILVGAEYYGKFPDMQTIEPGACSEAVRTYEVGFPTTSVLARLDDWRK